MLWVGARNFLTKRKFSSNQTLIFERLNRSLLSVFGEDVATYLQGLITNDIHHLSNTNSSQYAMFLNSKGRVLYDCIIYRFDSNTYLIECDSLITTALEKHLKMYKLKRKIDVSVLSDYQVYSLFDRNSFIQILSSGGFFPDRKTSPTYAINSIKDQKITIFKDPRISELGCRVITQNNIDIAADLSKSFNMQVETASDEVNYRTFRYALGVGEGVKDLPSGNCFPLESNCDYLHGVSFHKGCYIGQELTARTYHTGVTRKRLVPLFFQDSLKEIPDDIVHDKKKLGKLRGVSSNVGLALLRLDLLNSNQIIKIGGVPVIVGKPIWWPNEAPKNIQTSN